MTPDDDVALIDLDGSTADFDKMMAEELEKLRGPDEPPLGNYRPAPPHIVARQRLIKRVPGFWRNLPRLQLGFDVVDILREFEFQLVALSKGPRKPPTAWAEKVEWVIDNIPDASITVTETKHLTYGRALVDDWPEYYLPWLEVRPRGIVVAVAQSWNEGETHPRVVRYDGTNLKQVRDALSWARFRPSGGEVVPPVDFR
jgi:hypothetical protein